MTSTPTEEKPSIRLLRQELESWRPFVEALRLEDRQIARRMMDSCWRYFEAIESSQKEYLTEPFFLAILLTQERRLKELEAQLDRLKSEVESWKEEKRSKAGS